MKTRLTVLTALITCISLFAGKIYSQQNYNLSVYYKYMIKYETGKFYYPLGFGSTISRKISDKLILSLGLEYSHLYEEDQMRITPGVYRTEEFLRESSFSLISGITFPLLKKKIIIKAGGDIVSSYFRNSFELYRYTIADDLLDMHNKYYNNALGIGIKLKTDLQYNLSESVNIFIQPGYTYYLLGETKKEKFFTASTGLIFIL